MNIVECSSFTTRMGTGAQNVPFRDSSFQASAIIFWSNDPSNFANRSFGGLGWDDGINHAGIAGSIGGFGPQHFWSDVHSIVGGITTFSFELRLAAKITSLNIGSFDLQFDTNAVGGNVWNYYAFSIQVECQVGFINPNQTFPYTINSTIKPQAIYGMWHGGAKAGTLTGSGWGGAMSFGIASSCGEDQICIANEIYQTYQHQGKWLTRINSSGTITDEIEVTGWDFENKTITLSATSTTGEYQSYLIVGGGNISVNMAVFTEALSLIPIISNEPQGAMFFSFCNLESTTAYAGLRAAIGGTDGTYQVTNWMGANDNNIGAVSGDAVNIITLAHPTGSPARVIDGQASFVSFAPQTVNLTWPIDDGVARQCFGIIFGADPGESPTFCGGVCCTDGKRRIEVHLNGKRQFSASIAKDSYSFAGLIDALRNDIVTVVAYQEDGTPLDCIPSVEVHRVSYVQHLKESGRNLEEPD